MATADINSEIGTKVANDIGLKEEQLPAVYILQATQKLIKYEFEGDITE